MRQWFSGGTRPGLDSIPGQYKIISLLRLLLLNGPDVADKYGR